MTPVKAAHQCGKESKEGGGGGSNVIINFPVYVSVDAGRSGAPAQDLMLYDLVAGDFLCSFYL